MFPSLKDAVATVLAPSAGVGAHDTVVLTVAAAKVAGNGPENLGVIVDRENDGLVHHENPPLSSRVVRDRAPIRSVAPIGQP